MTNLRRILLAALSLLTVTVSFADTCSDLYKLPESSFTSKVRSNNATAASIANTLNQCVSNQACTYSSNPDVCMQNLYYYDAMATYYYQKLLHASNTRVSTSAPALNVASTQPTTVTTSETNTPTVLVPNAAPANNNPTTDSTNSDIYKNIRF